MILRTLLNPKFVLTIAILRQLVFFVRTAMTLIIFREYNEAKKPKMSIVGRTISVIHLTLITLQTYEAWKAMKRERWE